MATARIFDLTNSKSASAVKKRIGATVDQLTKWRDETKAALTKEADPRKRAGMAENPIHFTGLVKLYEEVTGSIDRAMKCKYKAFLLGKELPTRPTAEDYHKAYRIARAIVDTTKSCASNKSCWKEHIPSRSSVDSHVKVYKDLLKKVNGMERAVASELAKEYGDKKFISATAELCKAMKSAGRRCFHQQHKVHNTHS